MDPDIDYVTNDTPSLFGIYYLKEIVYPINKEI